VSKYAAQKMSLHDDGGSAAGRTIVGDTCGVMVATALGG